MVTRDTIAGGSAADEPGTDNYSNRPQPSAEAAASQSASDPVAAEGVAAKAVGIEGEQIGNGELSAPTRQRRRRAALIAAGAVVALAAGGTVLWSATRGHLDLEAGFDFKILGEAVASLDGADFNYNTGKVEWRGGTLTTRDEEDRRTAALAAAIEEATARACEDFTDDQEDSILGTGWEVEWALHGAVNSAVAHHYDLELTEAIESAERAADRQSLSLDELEPGSTEYEKRSAERASSIHTWIRAHHSNSLDAFEALLRDRPAAAKAAFSEEGVQEMQQIFVKRCDISTPAGWTPQTAAELEISLYEGE